MEVRGASFCVAKAMFCPRMLLTMTVMGDWVAASMVATRCCVCCACVVSIAVASECDLGALTLVEVKVVCWRVRVVLVRKQATES